MKSRSSNGAQARKRASSGATRAKSSGTPAKSTASRSKSTASRAKSSGGNAVSKVGEFASKAKTPLLAGGAALAGIAGGVAMKNRGNSRSPFKKIDLGKIDFETITSAAQRAGKIGQQVGDVAEAAEKARKKSK